MQYAVSTLAVHRTVEDVADSKPLKQGGAITVSTAHTLPVSY
jgi:hypothetical protein